MKHRDCSICGKPIVLVPSAKERAEKWGNSEKFYLDIFTTHSKCSAEKRSREAVELMKKLNGKG